MSRTNHVFEKLMRQLNSPDLSEEERQKMLDELQKGVYLDDYVSAPDAEPTADDYLEMAEEADDEEEAKRLAKKALKLDPDNLDAENLVIHMTEYETVFKYMKAMDKAYRHGQAVMEKLGLTDKDSIGDYWLLIETRPFMRILADYAHACYDASMYRKCAELCEEGIRLCSNDNLGLRYLAMHVYAVLEDAEASQRLLKTFPMDTFAMMVLPESMIQFKLGNEVKARNILKKLAENYGMLGDFFRLVCDGRDLPEDDDTEHIEGAYRPMSMQELQLVLTNYPATYLNAPAYIAWAAHEMDAIQPEKPKPAPSKRTSSKRTSDKRKGKKH